MIDFKWVDTVAKKLRARWVSFTHDSNPGIPVSYEDRETFRNEQKSELLKALKHFNQEYIDTFIKTNRDVYSMEIFFKRHNMGPTNTRRISSDAPLAYTHVIPIGMSVIMTSREDVDDEKKLTTITEPVRCVLRDNLKKSVCYRSDKHVYFVSLAYNQLVPTIKQYESSPEEYGNIKTSLLRVRFFEFLKKRKTHKKRKAR